MKHKRLLSLIMAILLVVLSVVSMSGCSAPANEETSGETKIFVDSCGREVEVPAVVDQIVPSGNLAQMILYTFDPDLFMGYSAPLKDVEKEYIDEKYWDLPVFGRFYGAGTTVNYEEIIKAAPDVIVDMGEVKPGIKEDMDALQADTGIPVVFIQSNINDLDKTYEAIGELTGNTERAEELSVYISNVLEEMATMASVVPESAKKEVIYAIGEHATEVVPKGSIHGEIFDMIGAVNPAELNLGENENSAEVSMEQLMLWDPDMLILAPDSCYETIYDDAAWAGVTALKEGQVYEAPFGPYSWIDRPPSMQRLLGIQWLGNLIYPEYFDYDIKERAKEFYEMFFHYELSDAELDELMVNSLR